MSDTLSNEKLFYERFNALMSNERLVEVFKRFGIEAFRRSSVLEGFEAFIRARNFRGDTCLEIGTLRGLTALVLAQYFQRVITVDIIDDPLKWAIARHLDVQNIVMINVADNAEKARVISEVRFDAAFIDGNHVKDTELDFSLVRKCGRVVFHEYWDAQPTVVRKVNELIATSGTVVIDGKFALWTA